MRRFRHPMAKERTSRPGSGGFTLLELMIALAIFSMVVLILTGGMRFAGRAWEAQEQRIDRQDDLGSLQNLLRSLIAAGRRFKGDDTSVTFVGAMPLALARPGLFDITLQSADDQLVMVWRSEARPGAVPEEMATTALARGVTGLDISYYVTDAQGQSGTWSASIDAHHPPALVRIVLLLAPGDSRHWPPLVVAPMIEPRG